MVVKWFRLMLCLFFLFDTTIEVILKQIYNNNEVSTSIAKNEMKELILLHLKGEHFTFDGKTYVQTNGVVNGSLLDPELSRKLMIELENNLIHTLSNAMLVEKDM